MSDEIDTSLGMNKNNEILNLWYEITYLRYLLSESLGKTHVQYLSQDTLKKAREIAQDTVRKRFPLFTVNFPEPQNNKEPNEKNNH